MYLHYITGNMIYCVDCVHESSKLQGAVAEARQLMGYVRLSSAQCP